MNEAAQITWKQISVPTKMACGVRKAVARGNTLRFQVHSLPMRFIEVTYNEGTDLYDIEYYRMKRGSYDKVSLETSEGVYCDMLSDIIYHMVNK